MAICLHREVDACISFAGVKWRRHSLKTIPTQTICPNVQSIRKCRRAILREVRNFNRRC